MSNDKLIIAFLLLVCVALLVALFGIGAYVMHRDAQHREKSPAKQEVVIVNRGDDRLPVYPVRDPVYVPRRMDAGFQQVGTLIYNGADDDTSGTEEPIILPLFGRPMPTRSDRWEYYTASDKQHMLKIPIMFENQGCLEEIGCREVYDKDTVFIPAYKKEFKVTLYKYQF